MSTPVFQVVRKFKFVEMTVDGEGAVLHWGHLSEGTGRETMRLSERVEVRDLLMLNWALTTVAPFSARQGLFRIHFPRGVLSIGLGKEVEVDPEGDYSYHGGRVMTYHLYDDTYHRVSMWIAPSECYYIGRMCELVGRILLERLMTDNGAREANGADAVLAATK